jgi:hypothetical protein
MPSYIKSGKGEYQRLGIRWKQEAAMLAHENMFEQVPISFLLTYMISECLRQASVSPHFTPKKLTFQRLYRIQAKPKKAKSFVTYF